MATLNIIPTAGQTLNQTRDPIRNNFTSIQDVFAVDHKTYGAINEGKHNQISFPNHVGALPATVGEIYLFNQTAAPTNIPDIWLKRGSSAAFPMTGSLNAAEGWTYLPSGILLKWGTRNAAGNSTSTHLFLTGANIPAFSNIFSIQITTNNGSDGTPNQLVTLGNYTTLQFIVFNRQLIGFSSAVNFTYLAIGN